MGRQADTYKKLFDDVRAGRVKALYFLHGPEEFMKREFLRDLATAVLPAGDRTFNIDVLHGDEFEAHAFDDRVQAFPLFATRRLGVLRNFDALSTSEREYVTARASALPDGLVLVVESGIEKLETVAHKKMAEVAAKNGVVVACAPLVGLDDYLVDDVVRAVMNVAQTGQKGDGRVFVIPVEEAYTVRTRAENMDLGFRRIAYLGYAGQPGITRY